MTEFDISRSYANALMHGTENMTRVGPNNPQHQNGGVNTMITHGGSRHFYSQYVDAQVAYPYMQKMAK